MDSKLTIGAFLLVLNGLVGAAESDGESGSTAALPASEKMVVIAHKVDRPLRDVAANVVVIEGDSVTAGPAQDIDQLLRFEPALGVESSGARFGTSSINVRGVGNNRVHIEVDGVPVRDQFDIGNFSNAGKDLLDPLLLKRIEVLTGPASTLYGSDALGGVVSIASKTPEDLVLNYGDSLGLLVKSGYHGETSSLYTGAAGAWLGERAHWLLAISHREGEALDNQSSLPASNDSLDWDSRALNLRMDASLGNDRELSLHASAFERQRDSDIQSVLGRGRFRSTTEILGDDIDESYSLSMDYLQQDFAGFDHSSLNLFHSLSNTEQRTLETRAKASKPIALNRDFFYEQIISGGEWNAFKSVSGRRADHAIGFGIEVQRTRSKERRDALQTTLADGSVTNRVLGEEFPLRDFPLSTTTELGAFFYDEITFPDSRWSLIPGVRFDHIALRPRLDPVFLADNPGTQVVDITERALSPKLGALYHFNDEWSGYLQYARGFRAAPFEDVNIGLDIPLFNIRAVPNPDLKSETSDGFEVGVRFMGSTMLFTANAYWTEFDDFIETKARIGIDPESGVLLFQSRNVDQARIYGLEWALETDLGAIWPKAAGLSADLSGHWARGENRQTAQPLNTLAPPRLVAGLTWEFPGRPMTAVLKSTFSQAQDRIDESAGSRFATPGYGITDMLLRWSITPTIQLSGGVYNASDKKYWRWLDVATFSADDPVVEVLSRPGRTYSVSVSARF